ncbi:MAG TPA: adenylate/guanylate cyclase domain-containing protein [Candidatus Limnocylindrales bacterium]|nr:adenylate/guanylate cyclase domain-containing protein [Candidatus Limnocylindrales bacterium]
MTEERRLVTVLFSDVTGSTALGEALDPEDMRALLAGYFAIARDVVAEHGGTIEKFIGDAVMAVFGLPTAHDDDAARAAAAALALRDRVRGEPSLGDRLPIRLGLATGEVVASMDEGAADFLITGDTVNVAARLQQQADSWDILCTDRAARAAGDAFAFGPPIEIEARGKAAVIRARRLDGHAQERRRARMPFLGRDADVAQLELTARRAVRERRPFLVTVTAPAGTGKTRLLEEFLELLPRLAPEARVLTAQCLPYGQQLTYRPLHTLLRDLLDVPDEAELDRVRAAAEAWLEGVGDANPRRTAELLAATFGAGDGEPIDRAELFAAWRATVESAARERPLVMVVEDLHWSSDSLLDLFEVVLQPRGDAPLLMIVLARPELLDRRPTWGGGRRNYVSLALEPLDDLAIGALVEFLLKGPPPEVVETVVARAEGNPFYAIELTRTIVERAVNLDDPATLGSLVSMLPDTIHAAVLARADLLPPAPRRVLQLGSVFGRSFAPAGIVALASDTPVELDVPAAIDHLVEHELVRLETSDEYTFRHILIREVAYQTMPRAERARLHAGAGRWLEARSVGREEEHAELVAFHLREAVSLGTAAGTDLDPVLVGKAVAWLRRAADVATAGAAYEEAARHIRAAIEIAPREDLPELWADLGDFFGGGKVASDAYATAVRLGRDLGRPPDFILRALAGELLVLGRWPASVGAAISVDELRALLDQVRAVRPTATDHQVIGQSYVAESFLPFGAITGGLGEVSDAEMEGARAAAEQAASIAREIDDPLLLSAALDALGGLILGYDPVIGLGLARQRVALEDRLPFYERIDVHNVLAWNHALLGDLDAALEAADSILRDLAPNQALALALSLAAWQVWALAMLGRWDEVAPAADRSIRIWEDAGRISAGYALQGFIAALGVGSAREDDRLASRARAVLLDIAGQFPAGRLFNRLAAFATPDPVTLVDAVILDWKPFSARLHHVALAVEVCVDRRQVIPPDALDQVLESARSRNQRLLVAHLLRARGVQQHQHDDLREARDLFRHFGARPSLARVEIELGQLIGDRELEGAGIAALEALGDLAHLGRIAARQRA